MRRFVIPGLMTALMLVVMFHQAQSVDPVLADPPSTRLPELPGFVSEVIPPSEAELHSLPSDTTFDKRTYVDEAGNTFMVSLVIGGRSKRSIHRPELCLPSQGFQMRNPHALQVGGVDWHCVSLESRGNRPFGFAYTFFNQEGFRTSSHLRRIFRDVWDRSVRGRIDRWAMLTVSAPFADDRRFSQFLIRLRGVVVQ